MAKKLELKWKDSIKADYIEIFEDLRKKRNLDFSDLTFDNFENVNLKEPSFDEFILRYYACMHETSFGLFSERFFEVDHPDELIEAYCFQSDFYKNYDLLLRKGKRSIKDVSKIGARIEENALSKCEKTIERYSDLAIFKLDLDVFRKLDDKTRKSHISELCHLIKELMSIDGIDLSKATKILHTLHPKIIPIIDACIPFFFLF